MSVKIPFVILSDICIKDLLYYDVDSFLRKEGIHRAILRMEKKALAVMSLASLRDLEEDE